MKRTHTRLLSDGELRLQLQSRDIVVFEVRDVSWQKVERQVERLGFGDLYTVSVASKPGVSGGSSRICLKPNRM